MKKLFPALTALCVLCAAWCAPAIATPPARGSTVLVPPLISKGVIKSRRPMTVMRLPTQAGKVSKVVTTNLVSNSPSWIAKGDKYYSLCAPNRHMVACAPIVATSIMRDIEVGALAGPKGEPLLTFKIAPGTRQAPKRLVYEIEFFLARTNKQVAHFNRKAVLYAPRPGATSARVGPTSNFADAGGGGGCSYDDEGSYDCSGGGVDGGGSGDSGSGSGAAGQCEGNCDYPSGNNNGDADPCIDENGNPICPVVEVPGQRPPAEEPMSLPTCRPTGPLTIECSKIPPVIGGEPPDIPKGPTPWFPQSMCNFSSIFCSAGQVPNNPPPLTDEERRRRAHERCVAAASAHATMCRDLQSTYGDAWFRQCMSDAIREHMDCDMLYNQPAP